MLPMYSEASSQRDIRTIVLHIRRFLRISYRIAVSVFLNKPDFIAYQNVKRPRYVLRKRKKGVMLLAWTSRKPDIDQKLNDAVIFEKYQPELRY